MGGDPWEPKGPMGGEPLGAWAGRAGWPGLAGLAGLAVDCRIPDRRILDQRIPDW